MNERFVLKIQSTIQHSSRCDKTVEQQSFTAASLEEGKISKELLLILFLTFAFFTGYYMLTPILPLYITSMGASKLELGLVIATLPATSIIARLPFSALSDRVGRWPIVVLAQVLQLLAYLFFSIAPATAWLYPITMIYGLAVSSFGPGAIAVALASSPLGRKGMVMGRFYASIGIAMIIGPLLTSLLTFYFAYSSVFLFASVLPAAGLAAFVWFGGSLLLKKPTLIDVQSEGCSSSILSSLKRVLFQRNILLLSASSVTFFIALGAFETMFAVYAKEDLGLRGFQVSLLFAARGIPNSLSRILAGNLSDRVGRRIPLLFSYTLTGVALLLVSMVSNVYLLLFLVGLYGLAWGARTAPSAALYSDNVLPVDTGLVSSLIWLTSDIAMALGSGLAGAMALILPTQLILRTTSVLVLIGLLGILLINEAHSRKDS